MKTRREPPGHLVPSPSATTDAAEEEDAGAARAPWVRCARCAHRIARPADRLAIDGKDAHEFMNPSGIRYVVVTYAAAPGCTPEGARSTVWTWFPGHAWQIEVCASCHAHLGWSFHGAGRTFYGLVRDHVVIDG